MDHKALIQGDSFKKFRRAGRIASLPRFSESARELPAITELPLCIQSSLQWTLLFLSLSDINVANLRELFGRLRHKHHHIIQFSSNTEHLFL